MRLSPRSTIDTRLPFLPFIPAVLAAAWIGGRGPGLLATIVSSLMIWYFFLPPGFTFRVADPVDAIRLLSFVLIGIWGAIVLDRLKSARRNAEQVKRQTVEALREKEERYRFNLEAANVGTWDWNIATGEVIWSDNMDTILGRPAGSFDGTLESVIGLIHPDDRQMVHERLLQAIESGEPYEVECRFLKPDGSVGWKESKGRAHYDAATGRPTRMMGVCTNVTERKNTEIALRESEERFRKLANQAPVGIFQLDEKGSCIFVNEHWLTLAGMTAEGAKGSGWARAVHPEDRDTLLSKRQKAIDSGRSYCAEYRIQRSDGKVSWAQATVAVMLNPSGEVTGFIGTTADITQRKLWEQELQCAKEKVTNVLESITESFIAVDRRWRFTYVNKPVMERVGKPLNEILGKNVWEFVPEAVETEFYSQCQRVMADRVAAHFQFRHRSGLWIDAYVHPTDEGLSAYILDITERKRYEQALSQLAAIVDSSDDTIISTDLEGVILTWNSGAQRMYGYTAQEAIGRNVSLLVPIDRQLEAHRILEKVKAGSGFEHFETVRCRKDSKPLSVSLTISAIRDSSGAIVATSQIARDITERKALEEQLRRAAKLESLGVLAGGIAHDFNNLLVGILGNASLARDLLALGNPAAPMLDDVIHASERAANLTRQLLAYSGKGKFIIQAVGISELVRDMVGLLRVSMPRTVELRLDVAQGLPPVVADATQMQQLIMNLVINASEAIGDSPGAVTIATGVQDIVGQSSLKLTPDDEVAPGKYVFLAVRDNGCGMDEATVAKIFDPFFTTKFTGRGLGLSAALGIVRGHKGLIQVESAPGRGSTFRVLLPAAQEMTAEAETKKTEQDLTGSGLILVVDDEEVVRHTATAALESYGYQTVEASNGLEAIRVVEESLDIALVVLDLSMPVMSGDECLKQLREIKPELPVILSSGFNEAEAVRRFQAESIKGFLQKPYTASRLAELLKQALDGAVRRRTA